MFRPGVTGAVVLLCACIAIASAQQRAQSSRTAAEQAGSSVGTSQDQSIFHHDDQYPQTLQVFTRMVPVDAIVTDSSSMPIPNLKAEDFRVFENGKLQKIRAFGVRSPELLKEQGAHGPATPTLPPGLFTNITDFHVEYGPLTIILIDSLNTPDTPKSLQLSQVYMRDALIKYLQGMGARQNVAIFTLGTRLGLVQNLDADPQLLQEALKRIQADPKGKKKQPRKAAPADDLDSRARALAADLLGVGPAYNKERQIAQIEQSVNEFFPDRALPQVDTRAEVTTGALRQIARSVGGYPGRKNLIWLSAAFPLWLDPIHSGLGSTRNYEPEVKEAANLLTNAEIAVYPVDVRGLVADALPGIPSGIIFGASHATMDRLAEDTGGRAYYNRNDIDHGIAASVHDGSSYYSLGYYPADKNWDGKFRKIEVKLARSGLKVRYRHGYFATDTAHPTPEQAKAARQDFLNSMALDAPAATLLPVVAYVTPPDKAHPQVLVNIGVDPHAVIFEPQGNNRQRGEVEFATIVLNADGKPLTSKSDILNTELTPETFARVMSGSLVVRQTFDLTPGRYLLRMGVRDLKSNLFGTLTARVDMLPQAHE